MSERTVQTVECELCGEPFDPTDAGGWCTNPDCGEWQYQGAALADESSEGVGNEAESDAAEDESVAASAVGEDVEPVDVDDETDDVGETDDRGESGDAYAESSTADVDALDEAEAIESPEGEASATADAAGAVESDDVGPESTPADEEEKEPAIADDAASVDAVDAPEAAETEPDSVVECVDCGATVERDANFCPTCGGEVVERTLGGDDELTECPSCAAEVEPEDNFCASCGEDLEAHRGSDPLTECPDCGADVDEDDAFCAQCGEDLDAHRSGDADAGPDDADDTDAADAVDEGASTDETPESAPETLSLEAYGQSVDVGDGDAIGREVRSLLADAGRPDDEAVRIHREHVRFVREDGEFYLVDLGDNPTAVNGRTLSKGDREPIAPGDEVTLSDVVTLSVASPDA